MPLFGCTGAHLSSWIIHKHAWAQEPSLMSSGSSQVSGLQPASGCWSAEHGAPHANPGLQRVPKPYWSSSNLHSVRTGEGTGPNRRLPDPSRCFFLFIPSRQWNLRRREGQRFNFCWEGTLMLQFLFGLASLSRARSCPLCRFNWVIDAAVKYCSMGSQGGWTGLGGGSADDYLLPLQDWEYVCLLRASHSRCCP